MNVKARIEIVLTSENQIALNTSSQNQITNLGMLGVAMAMVQKGITAKEPSSLVIPQEIP